MCDGRKMRRPWTALATVFKKSLPVDGRQGNSSKVRRPSLPMLASADHTRVLTCLCFLSVPSAAQVEPSCCPTAGIGDSVATTYADPSSPMASLGALLDDVLLLIIEACSDGHLTLPELDAVRGLGYLCKDVLQQLHRLRPVVRMQVHNLEVAQRLARITHSPWRIVLSYTGVLTEAVVEQATRGRIRSINARRTTLAPAVAARIVPELLGAGCSLLDLKLESVRLDDSWAAAFGEAAVCSKVLTELQIDGCSLRGPLPQLRLPALQALFMYRNALTGGLEPLIGCTALRELDLSDNRLTGGLEPLRGCTALHMLDIYGNQLSGGLEALQGCTALRELDLTRNRLTGGLEPLMACKALQVGRGVARPIFQHAPPHPHTHPNTHHRNEGRRLPDTLAPMQELDLSDNQLTGGLEMLMSCTALHRVDVSQNQLTGSLSSLQGLRTLSEFYATHNRLTGSLYPLMSCTALRKLDLSHNYIMGGLEPLRGCTALKQLYLTHNQLTGALL